MKLILVSLAFVATAIAARYADAADKPSKPVVCSSYQLAKSEAGTVALCYDGKKPFVMTRFAEVSAPGKSEGTVKVLVGWR